MIDEKKPEWSQFEWQRRLETIETESSSFDRSDPSWWDIRARWCCCIRMTLITPMSSAMAEITDTGRQTTLSLGRCLRHLYVDQLGFLPGVIGDPRMIFLRSSPWPRALDSLQQVFTGLYPPDKRKGALTKPTIVTRRLIDETLLPNEEHCERLIELIKAFSKRTAQRCEWAQSK